MVCFSSIIRSVSNADDNCTRTVIRKKLNKIVNPSDALRKFAEAVLTNIPKMIEFSHLCAKDIITVFLDNMDARDIKYDKEHSILHWHALCKCCDPKNAPVRKTLVRFTAFACASKKTYGTESTGKDYKELHQSE